MELVPVFSARRIGSRRAISGPAGGKHQDRELGRSVPVYFSKTGSTARPPFFRFQPDRRHSFAATIREVRHRGRPAAFFASPGPAAGQIGLSSDWGGVEIRPPKTAG